MGLSSARMSVEGSVIRLIVLIVQTIHDMKSIKGRYLSKWRLAIRRNLPRSRLKRFVSFNNVSRNPPEVCCLRLLTFHIYPTVCRETLDRGQVLK